MISCPRNSSSGATLGINPTCPTAVRKNYNFCCEFAVSHRPLKFPLFQLPHGCTAKTFEQSEFVFSAFSFDTLRFSNHVVFIILKIGAGTDYISVGQGCPTFQCNGPHCKLKCLTGPQNHQSVLIQFNEKITI